MKIYYGSNQIHTPPKGAVVAIGNFDGVHLGHREIIKEIRNKAQEIGGTSVVYTFHPHPSRVIRPESAQLQINSIEERLELIEKQKIDVTIVEQFNRELSEKSAEEFFSSHILQKLQPKHIYVGYNFFFGKGREGNIETLKALCAKHKIECHVIPPFMIGNETVNSSKIRSLILDGNVQRAALFLGRQYFIQGLTIKGVGRGKKLGVPTANIQTPAELIPKMGVYTTLIEYHGDILSSVTNVGHAPTFIEKMPLSVETHILNFKKDIYGESFKLHFVDRIRDIKKFKSPEALVEQIKKDIEAAKAFFRKEES